MAKSVDQSMKILVTGGAGYVGSHICKALSEYGYEPVTYDNLSRGNRWAVRWGPLEVGDIADLNSVHRVLIRYRPIALIHLAAYAYVGESVENPLLYYQNNVAGSATLFRGVIETRAIPIIFSSTCAIYGIPNQTTISEDHSQHPINPYGFSKLIVERMLSDLDAAYRISSVSLRYFNAAGADPSGVIGEAHDPETHLIPRVLAAAQDGSGVTIFGDDYDTLDGTCVRDYIHVGDIADAHVRALNYLLAGGPSRALNLANTRGHSVLQVIEMARHVCGKSIQVKRAPRRPGDPPALVGSAERAKVVLGWVPNRSELNLQIEDAWNWMIKRRYWRGLWKD